MHGTAVAQQPAIPRFHVWQGCWCRTPSGASTLLPAVRLVDLFLLETMFMHVQALVTMVWVCTNNAHQGPPALFEKGRKVRCPSRVKKHSKQGCAAVLANGTATLIPQGHGMSGLGAYDWPTFPQGSLPPRAEAYWASGGRQSLVVWNPSKLLSRLILQHFHAAVTCLCCRQGRLSEDLLLICRLKALY